jgi:hypothetical protein
VTISGRSSGRAAAFALCVFLILFMTAEVSHTHPPVDGLQHDSCPWCSAAHLAPTLISPLLAVVPGYIGETVALRECVETALLVIPLQFIRPPPHFETIGLNICEQIQTL